MRCAGAAEQISRDLPNLSEHQRMRSIQTLQSILRRHKQLNLGNVVTQGLYTSLFHPRGHATLTIKLGIQTSPQPCSLSAPCWGQSVVDMQLAIDAIRLHKTCMQTRLMSTDS